MNEFKREERYIVVKIKHINEWQQAALRELLAQQEIQTVACVVVEQHWREVYEQTWDAVQRYAEGRPQRIAELEARLEMGWVYDSEGNKVKSSLNLPDGIACRDETIRLQDEQIERLKADNAELRDTQEELLSELAGLVSIDGRDSLTLSARKLIAKCVRQRAGQESDNG